MLIINTTPALIGISTTPGKLSIQQPKADVSMHTEHPKVEIDNKFPKVKIDQYECFAERGMKNYLDLTKETVQLAKQSAMQGIERRVRQGNELAAIENGRNPIARQAEENAFELFNKEFGLDFIPKSRPRIELIEGKPKITVHEGKVNIDVKVNKPIINYTRGKVDIYLRQKNSIDIQYVGEKIDKQI